MKFKNRKKDGFSIIEVMVSFVIIIIIVLLIGPNLFSTYERSKEMSKVSDASAIINVIDMHNLNRFMEGEIEAISDNITMSELRQINEQYKYLNNWPKWVTDSMTLKDIKDIANNNLVNKSTTISRAIDNRV